MYCIFKETCSSAKVIGHRKSRIAGLVTFVHRRREQDKKNGGAWERCSFGGLVISSLEVPRDPETNVVTPEKWMVGSWNTSCFLLGFRPVLKNELFFVQGVKKNKKCKVGAQCSMVMSKPWRRWCTKQLTSCGFWPPRLGEMKNPDFFFLKKKVEETGGGKNPEDYPPGNDHMSHLGKFGKSSTQICRKSGGDVTSLEGNQLFLLDFWWYYFGCWLDTIIYRLKVVGNCWVSFMITFV